jgi:hypothetical protein
MIDLHIAIADGKDVQRYLRDAMRKDKERQMPRHKQSENLRSELDEAADEESMKTSDLNADAKGSPPPMPVSSEDVSDESAKSLPKKQAKRKKSSKKLA